ncbi:hypothetical protein IWW56_004650 [Coemansia sp. RSA 2131]|nr:hypothetical protein IWW56_004650 [Coemansia sp. RSA 2131]
MADTGTLHVKYYNDATFGEYEYSVTDTVESFFAKHTNIGDIHVIYFGPFIYDVNSTTIIHSIVQSIAPGQEVTVFPESMVINVTHINLANERTLVPFNVSPILELNKLVDDVREHFGIYMDTKCEFYSDIETELPGNVHEFNFQTTEFYIKEVHKE